MKASPVKPAALRASKMMKPTTAPGMQLRDHPIQTGMRSISLPTRGATTYTAKVPPMRMVPNGSVRAASSGRLTPLYLRSQWKMPTTNAPGIPPGIEKTVPTPKLILMRPVQRAMKAAQRGPRRTPATALTMCCPRKAFEARMGNQRKGEIPPKAMSTVANELSDIHCVYMTHPS